MYRISLPKEIGAGDNKGKPNLVEITSAKMTQTVNGRDEFVKYGDQTYVDAKGNERKGILASRFEAPQFGPEPTKNDKGDYLQHTEDQAKEALDEMIKDAGGIVAFTENYNNNTAKAAYGEGKNYIRNKEGENPTEALLDSIVTEGLRRSREYTWASEARVTNKSVREDAEKLEAELDNLDEAELKRRIRAMLGKA